MNFQQQLPSELYEITNDLEKGNGGRRKEAGGLRLQSAIETTLLKGDVSLEMPSMINIDRIFLSH